VKKERKKERNGKERLQRIPLISFLKGENK